MTVLTLRLIGFEELGQTDAFTSKTLKWRLKRSGVLHDGPITLQTMLPEHMQREAGSDADDDSDDDARFRDKSRRNTRSGKVGIRDGLAGKAGDDDDEYE